MGKVLTKSKNFVVTRELRIEELQVDLTELVHEPTGAQILHLGNEDHENVFNLTFNTRPENSTGVAHILEHIALCGSKKYPLPDPFFEMTRRSLNTFMNAFTGPDYTCYPASSQVRKDFYNLLDVYIDAVFHPLLTKESFLQEGNRLEFEDKEDIHSPLHFQGIVYNEMKGALATGEARLHEYMMEATYPDLTYCHNSGGDPRVIPDLTHEELKAFHAEYYHPSRCQFYFYGNIPLEDHLEYLEERVFKGVQKMEPLPPLPKQPRFTEAKELEKTYPVAEGEEGSDKTFVGFSWLTCSVLDQEELLALNVLDVVLMGTDASPLKMALLKSNLCQQADAFMDNEMSEVPLLLVCKGCAEDAAPKLKKLVQQTLGEIVYKGLDPKTVEGAIHQLEMSRSEIINNHTPYGLILFFRSGLIKMHGGKPEEGLVIHTLFSKLREKVKDPKYLTGLIEKHFLKNSHFIALNMKADREQGKQEREKEEQWLREISDYLTEEQKNAVVEDSLRLVEIQESEKEVDLLPKVCLDDVEKKEREYEIVQEQDVFSLHYHPCFTNDLIYSDIVYDLPDIPEEDLSLLRFFTFLLPQLGCAGRTYAENLDYLLEHTGGLGVVLDLNMQAENPHQIRPSITVRGKSLARKKDKLFPLMRELITSVSFDDKERIQELLMQHYHAMDSSIQNNSLKYAVNLAASGYSVPSKILNDWYGISYYHRIKELYENFDERYDGLIAKMLELQKMTLGLEHPQLILCCDQENHDILKREKFYGLEELPMRPYKQWKGGFSFEKVSSQGRLIASPVAFTTALFPSICYSHPDSAALSVAAEIILNQTLHKRIREQGGAYGSGAVNGILAGNFYFYAFRDPNLKSTLDAFREGVETVASGSFGEREIEEAKLGIFQELDAPISPGARADLTYFRRRGGRTPEKRQQYRDRLFAAGKSDIQRSVQAHLLPGLDKATTISFASKEFFDKEQLQENPLPLYPV